jgi:hypothetical protein
VGVAVISLSSRPPAATLNLRGCEETMAIGTFALGMFLFVLFFGLIAACDRL